MFEHRGLFHLQEGQSSPGFPCWFFSLGCTMHLLSFLLAVESQQKKTKLLHFPNEKSVFLQELLHMKASPRCTDKNRRLANVLGWRRREGEGSGEGGKGVEWGAQRVLQAECSPSQNTAGGAGFYVAHWPNFSLAMPPTVLGSQRGAGPGKTPGAFLP